MSLLDKASLILVPGSPQKASEIWAAKPVTQSIGVTRGTTKFRTNASGLLQSVAANVAALDYRYAGALQSCPAWLVENAATNSALHSRDLTNAVWVRTNMSATRDQVGADGSANTATRLTATAANATILQSLTLASAQRTWSAWIRRLTGTGRIEMTMNGGASWVIVTSGITSTFAPISIPAQTLANNSVGFRIADAGDEIAVDFVQLEAGSVRTSPIITAASTATRNADSISLTGASALIGQTQGTVFVDFNYDNNNGTSQTAISLTGGANSANDSLNIYKFGANNLAFEILKGGTSSANIVLSIVINGVFTSFGRYKIALSYQSISAGVGTFLAAVNGQQVTGTITSNAAMSSGNALSRINLGAYPNDSFLFQNTINAAAIYTSPLTTAELAQLTTL